jgi:hypothetical protein
MSADVVHGELRIASRPSGDAALAGKSKTATIICIG